MATADNGSSGSNSAVSANRANDSKGAERTYSVDLRGNRRVAAAYATPPLVVTAALSAVNVDLLCLKVTNVYLTMTLP